MGIDILFLKCVKNKSMNFSNLIFLRISYMSHVLPHFHHFLSPLQLLQSSSNPLLNLRPLFLCYCYICYIHVHITYICVHMYICESIEYSSYLCMFRTDNVQLDNLSGVNRNGTWKAFIVTNCSNYVCMYVQLYTHVYVCICAFVHVCMVYAFTYMLLFSDYIKVLLFLFFSILNMESSVVHTNSVQWNMCTCFNALLTWVIWFKKLRDNICSFSMLCKCLAYKDF